MRPRELVNCPECGEKYTKPGLGTHRFSQRCTKNQETAPVKTEIAGIIRKFCKNKQRVSKTFVNAVERRGGWELREALGVVCLMTKLFCNADGDWRQEQEYWADSWVVQAYRVYLDDNSVKLYDDLVRYHNADQEERQMIEQMLLLKCVGLDG